MSALAPLLEVQELDLTSDRLAERRRTLSERARLDECQVRAGELDASHADLVAQRETLGRDERQLGAEVSELAGRAREIEDRLYSGTIKAPRELESWQEDLRLLREHQGEIEGRELELLEQIEEVEGRMAENRAARAEADAEMASLRAAIETAEQEIDAEIARLGRERDSRLPDLPDAVVAEYQRLRGRERLRGRAAAARLNGVCGGCRVKLPVLEYSKMKAQPDEALLCCVACGRVLVR